MTQKFKKAKSIFQKYTILEEEIETLQNRIKTENYADIISSDFVNVDINIKRELVAKTLKFKTEELLILEKDFDETVW